MALCTVCLPMYTHCFKKLYSRRHQLQVGISARSSHSSRNEGLYGISATSFVVRADVRGCTGPARPCTICRRLQVRAGSRDSVTWKRRCLCTARHLQTVIRRAQNLANEAPYVFPVHDCKCAHCAVDIMASTPVHVHARPDSRCLPASCALCISPTSYGPVERLSHVVMCQAYGRFRSVRSLGQQ